MFSKDKKEEKSENLKQNNKEAEDSLIQIKKSELESLHKELEDYKQKSSEYFDRFLRLQAEFDNAKKRMQRQQQDFVKYANEGIILEFLGILDDLERSVEARESNHQDPQAFLKGVELILSHLYEMLKKHEVKPIDAKGKMFDPTQHEALMQVESSEYPENTVAEELQKGYLLGDRVIRTAKVKVATAKSADKKSTDDADKKKEGQE